MDLPDEDLILMSGQCSHATQLLVDAAAARLRSRTLFPGLTAAQAGLVADAVAEARERGRLIYRDRPLTYCGMCETAAGYVEYRSGPRRGHANHNRPKYLAGVELAFRFITVKGHAALGGCRDCVEPCVLALKEALSQVSAELPSALGPSRFKYRENCLCSCGWVGHDGLRPMFRAYASGTPYPRGCPVCADAGTIRSRPGFTLQRIEAEK